MYQLRRLVRGSLHRLQRINELPRVINDYFITRQNLKEEKEASEFLRSRLPEKDSIVDNIFKEIEDNKWGFRGWALSKSSIKYFYAYLSDKSEKNIVEFGGGSSTIFWNELLRKQANDFNYITLEHHPEWADKLKSIDELQGEIFLCKLKQLDDTTREEIFLNPKTASAIWEKSDKYLSVDDYCDTRARNCFYDIPESIMNSDIQFDGIILDGPHGNGRSIAFPLLYNHIKPGTIVLLDDYTHYPFLDDLKQVYDFEILKLSDKPTKSWIIVKVIGKNG